VKNRIQRLARNVILGIIDLLGSDIRDIATGERIGRALFLPWRGRILVFGSGLAGYSLVPKFCPKVRLTFWRCEIGFTRHPEPDYPHERRS
jgi:hypothetical protein